MIIYEGYFDRPPIRLSFELLLCLLILLLIGALFIVFLYPVFRNVALFVSAVLVIIIVLIVNKKYLYKVAFESDRNNISAYCGTSLVKQVYGEIRYKIIVGTERNNVSGFSNYRIGLDTRLVRYDTRYVRRLLIKSLDTKDVLSISEPFDGNSNHERDSSESMSDFLSNQPGVIDEIVKQLESLHIKKLA